MTWAEAFDWNTWVHSILGGVHFAVALLALVLGPVIFLNTKGGQLHRLAGYAYVLSMLTVNITALTNYDFTGYPNLFHFFALLSLSSLIPAFYTLQRAVRLRDNERLATHANLMMWSYYGLAAAGVAQVATRVLPPLIGDFGRAFTYFGVALGIAGFLCWPLFRIASTRIAKRYQFENESPLET